MRLVIQNCQIVQVSTRLTRSDWPPLSYTALLVVSRKSNRTDIGCADSWPKLGPNASNGATSCKPISGICKRFWTAGNVSCARRTNRNEPWSENWPTKTADSSRTLGRLVQQRCRYAQYYRCIESSSCCIGTRSLADLTKRIKRSQQKF